MSSKFALFFFLLFSLLFQSSFPAFLAPITKDPATGKYTLSIYLKTPPRPTNLLLDLGAPSTLVDCSKNYTSSTYHSIPCGSSLCISLGSHSCSLCSGSAGPGCSNDSCALLSRDSATRRSMVMGEALVDSLSLHTTNGRNPGRFGVIPRFIFSCTKRSLLKGIAKGSSGLSGLGRSGLSIPAQISKFSHQNSSIFALCLSGSPSAPGVAFFSTTGPYYFLPEIDLSNHLNYTSILSHPIHKTGRTSAILDRGYFIGLTSIKVNKKVIQLHADPLLTVDGNKGFVAAELSTVTRYTLLQTKIFKAFTVAFIRESAALNLTVREPIKPFHVCYDADNVLSTIVGPAVPTIDLVTHDRDGGRFWRIFGSNSMVRIFRDGVDAWCLGFLDGGAVPKTSSIVVGGHQMEDNLLQFDLPSKRLGFSSTILAHGTMCANFNFTSNY